MKKMFWMVCIFALLFSLAVGVPVAATAVKSDVIVLPDGTQYIDCSTPMSVVTASSYILPNASPRYEDQIVKSRVASINVYVQTPLEEAWIEAHSGSYYYDANSVVERIDDYLYDEFGIDFYVYYQPTFSTNATYGYGILQAAMSQCGLGGADIMLAFAGYIESEGEFIGGISLLGSPYAAVFDHGYYQNCKSAQHELGHTYGLNHCNSVCVMKAGEDPNWSYFEHLCSTHNSQWENSSGMY